MKIFNFAICDDEEVAISAIRGTLERLCAENGVTANINCFTPSAETEAALSKGSYSALFLDIDMQGFDGIELGKRLKEKNPDMHIIYISNEEGSVFESFEVHPYGFVRKSNFSKDLGKVVKIFFEEFSETGQSNLEITSGAAVENIVINDILYIESFRESQFLVMKNNQKKRIRLSMNELEKKLGSAGFIRVHKSYLVNYRYIRRIDRTGVIINNGENLPISRKKVQDVRNEFMKRNRKDISLTVGRYNAEDENKCD